MGLTAEWRAVPPALEGGPLAEWKLVRWARGRQDASSRAPFRSR